MSFTVKGASTLYGNVEIGATFVAATLTVHGDVTLNDVGVAQSTFATGTGAISLKGDTTVDTNRNLDMGGGSGSGTFTTATGDVTMNGDVTISGSKTFTTGTGTVLIKGSPVNFDATPGSSTIVNFGTSTEGIASGQAFGSGTGALTTFWGKVEMGGSNQYESTYLKLYGHFDQVDEDVGGTPQSSTFTTGTGAITMNGNIGVDTGKNLIMAGASDFTTGTGTVTINGDAGVTVAGPTTFNDDVTIDSLKTFTFGGNAVDCGGGTTEVTANQVCRVSPR
jgi:hypothetical protein